MIGSLAVADMAPQYDVVTAVALSTARLALLFEKREVLIARTSVRCRTEYEWGVHTTAFGRPLGLTDQQVYSTVHGEPEDPCTVMRLADELHDTSTVSDGLFAELADTFDDPRILELTVTAGWYHPIALVIAVAGIDQEPWAATFPAIVVESFLRSGPGPAIFSGR